MKYVKTMHSMDSTMSSFKRLLPVLVAVLVIVPSATAFAFYRELQTVKQNPQRVAQEETKKLLDRVAELIVLPAGEEPTIATVADPEKLSKEQAFFANAKKGDKVLIYTNAKKAILYDPANHKIVEVAPISIGNQPAATSATGTRAP